MKHNNAQIMGIPEREVKDQKIENLFEKIMTENFPNLVREKFTQVWEAECPNQDKPKEAHSKTHYN